MEATQELTKWYESTSHEICPPCPECGEETFWESDDGLKIYWHCLLCEEVFSLSDRPYAGNDAE